MSLLRVFTALFGHWPFYQGYSKTCVKRPFSKTPKIGFQDKLSLNAGQKYCRMLQGEHSAILSTFIKLPIVIKIFVLSIFELPFHTGFTVFIFFIKVIYRFYQGHLTHHTVPGKAPLLGGQ